jgi:hypothetical protein
MRIGRIRPYNILAGVLLQRPPLLNPEIHPFEREVYRYQDMIEKHQTNKFHINFYFKKGSIGEVRWKREHKRGARRSPGGIIRPRAEEDEPEWFVGGSSDANVMEVRHDNAMRVQEVGNKSPDEEKIESKLELAREEEEDDDLEGYSEEEVAIGGVDIPEEIRLDYHRLEREPSQTLYCIVKRSATYHTKSGRIIRGWELPSCEAIGRDENHELEGLHMVRLLAYS